MTRHSLTPFKIFKLKSFGNDPIKVTNLFTNYVGFYDVDVGLGTSTDGIRILAISDINNDKYDDLITLNSANNIVTIRYFDPSSMTYLDTASITLSSTASVQAAFITNTPTLL